MLTRRYLTISTLVAGFLLVALPARGAVELKVSDDYFMKLGLLVQPWVQLTNDPQSATDLASDFYVRRTRVIMSGQVSKWVSFFMETDIPNWGKGGNWTPDFFVQDVFVTGEFGEAFKLDVGMILPAFVRQSRQGATSLHTLDYHTALVKYPAGMTKVWRDMGVGARGLLFDKKLDYRVSVTNGKVGPVDDIPRFTGRLAYNFFDAEEGFFLGGTYLGAKRVLSIGAAFDVQPDIVDGGNAYYALGGDVFWDLPMNGGDRLSGQVDFVYYRGLDGKKPVLDAQGQPVLDAAGQPTTTNALLDTTGMGLLFDIGYAFGAWEPIIAVDWFMPKDASDLKDQFLGVHVGLNWWFQGHTANLKFDAGLIKDAGEEFGDAARVFTIQTQLLF
jgi:hypothetical protein